MDDELTNLWEETINKLKRNGYDWEDVLHVIIDGHIEIPKTNFEHVARNTNYDSGYGSAKINLDLMIVGPDWWLERHEYDGAECWRFKSMPEIPQIIETVKDLWERDI